MKRSFVTLFVALVALTVLMAGCAPAPAPAQPAEGKGAATEPAAISIWHGFIETEEELFSTVTEDFMAANPDITVQLLAVPFDELQNKFQTEASTGGGPTMTTGPQDRMAGYVDADLLAELDTSAGFLSDLIPAALEGGKIGGTLYGIPISNKVVALYYNKSVVDAPPEDFDALLAAASEHGLALTLDWFHNYMWVPAFGAQLFDDDLKAVLDTTGADEAFDFLKTVCESDGVTCDGNDGDMDILYRSGEAAFRVQGPWMSGDAVKDLGAENVGVARVPTIPGAGDPRPWNQSEVIQINVNASEAEVAAAMRFIEYLTSADIQKMYMDKANWIPSNANVDISGNPIVGGFAGQVPFSDPFPVVAELGATWAPMGDAVTKIIEGVLSPADAIAEATALINEANGK